MIFGAHIVVVSYITHVPILEETCAIYRVLMQLGNDTSACYKAFIANMVNVTGC